MMVGIGPCFCGFTLDCVREEAILCLCLPPRAVYFIQADNSALSNSYNQELIIVIKRESL